MPWYVIFIFFSFNVFLSTGECRWKNSDAEYLVNKLAIKSQEKDAVLKRISTNENIEESDEVLGKLKIKPDCFSDIYVGGMRLSAPETFEGLKEYLKKVNLKVNYLENKIGHVDFRFGSMKVVLKHPYMARGKHAKVYDILDDQVCVFKLTVPTLAALRCVIEDNENDPFWAGQQKQIENLVVPERLHKQCPAGGLYRVFKRSSGITLTKALLAWNILEISESADGVSQWDIKINWPLTDNEDMKLFEPVERVILDLLAVIKRNKKHNISLAPNNLLVVFESNPAKRFKSVDLVDTGVSVGTKLDENARIMDFSAYLEMAKKRLNKYLTDEIHVYDVERLKRAQGKREEVFFNSSSE